MSGSSGSSSRDDYPSYSDSCDTLEFDTQLASPKEDVIAQFGEGDVLEVAFDQQHGQAIVYALWRGQIAGGIASQQVQRLRQCLTEGTMYSARVISKQGGQVRVRVFPLPRL